MNQTLPRRLSQTLALTASTVLVLGLSACQSDNQDNSQSKSSVKKEETSVTIGADGKTTITEKEVDSTAGSDDNPGSQNETDKTLTIDDQAGKGGKVKVDLPGIKVDIDESAGSVNVSTPYVDVKKDGGKSQVQINLEHKD